MKKNPKIKDRRIQKTRASLQEALISLMFDKNYAAIVVQDILDRANIGRSTFYMHYRDKDDLLIDGLQNLREYLLQAKKPYSVSTSKNHEKVIAFSLALFEHTYSHKDLFKSLIGGGGQGWVIVRQHMEDMIIQLIKEEARPLFKKKSVSEIPFELFSYFLGSTFMSVITWWLNHRNPLPPKEINVLFRELVVPGLAAHLN